MCSKMAGIALSTMFSSDVSGATAQMSGIIREFTNFTRKGTKRALEYHPTVKPILLVSDAILDSTNRKDIVLDPFLGSGTSLLAAERTGRRCYGVEIDPLYVDTAIERWQRLSGQQARNRDGVPFDEIKRQRNVEP